MEFLPHESRLYMALTKPRITLLDIDLCTGASGKL
jgi:hypothetical protein